jgi:hypothetical protein
MSGPIHTVRSERIACDAESVDVKPREVVMEVPDCVHNINKVC